MKEKKHSKENSIKRRSFLKLTGASLGLGISFPYFAKWGNVNAGEPKISGSSTQWQTDPEGNLYFVPKNIKTDKANDKGIVTARVDGMWKKYKLAEYDSEFHEWWISEKLWYYDQLIAYFNNEIDETGIPNGGHHHPILGTYGRKFGRRGDSDFHLNTAVKGFTIVPKAESIDIINTEVDNIYAASEAGKANLPVDLFKLRKDLYQDRSLWDKTRMGTLELYSGRPINAEDTAGGYGFDETKTFQNIMANPMSTLTYMGFWSTEGGQNFLEGIEGLIPEWTFKGFCWLIAHHNPANSEYEQKISTYINDAHCRYHGGNCDIATNIFLVVEEFNTTPSYDPYGRGKRVVPPYNYGTTASNMANVKLNRNRKKLSKEEKIEVIKKLKLPV